MDTSALLADQYLSPVVLVDKIKVISEEDATNIRISVKTAGEWENTPPPSPYEERFFTPTVEKDQRPGPSYYSGATCARTLGDSQTSMKHPKSDADGDDRMDADSLDEDAEVCVTDGECVPDEVEREKRARGHRPTHGKYVGIREKREKEKLEQEEAELEQRTKEALIPDVPTGATWKKILREGEKMEDQLRFSPTESIATQLLEHSAILFKTADCSKNMKGSLVGQMKKTVALIRAATTVLTRRAREEPGTTKLLAIRRDLADLRAENEGLRREVGRLKSLSGAPVTQSPPIFSARSTKRAAALKRRRVVESDEDSNELRRVLPNIGSTTQFPPLSTPSGEKRGRQRVKEAQVGTPPATLGPSLKGRARPVEPLPLGLSEEKRTTLIWLREQRDNVLSQLDLILSQISALEINAKDENLAQLRPPANAAPVLSQVPSVIGEEAEAFKPLEEHRGEQKKTPPVALAAKTVKPQEGGRKKKKGKKTGGGQAPSPLDTRPNERGKGGANATPLTRKDQPGPSRGKPQLSSLKSGSATDKGKSPSKSEDRNPPNKRNPAPSYPLKGQRGSGLSVVGRKAGGRRSAGEKAPRSANPPTTNSQTGKRVADPTGQQPTQSKASPSTGKRRGKGRRRRVPRTKAVVITCLQGEYKDNLRLATDKIDPASLGIDGMTARRAVTGAKIFEIGGPEKREKADAPAAKIREVLADREGVRVTRPSATAELRVKDLHDAIEGGRCTEGDCVLRRLQR